MQNIYGGKFRDKRRNGGKRRGFDIQKLWEKNHEILNYVNLGLKDKQIANIVGVTPATVSNTKNSSLGQEKLQVMRGARDENFMKVRDEIDALSVDAIEFYKKVLQSEENTYSASLMHKMAKDILIDLAGHGAPKKLDVRAAHLLDPEFLEVLKENGRKAAKECGYIVDS